MPSVTRPSVKRPQNRADVESRVLAATAALLAEGLLFTELGVARIAAKAGVARSTFYLYFADKTRLLIGLASDLEESSFDLLDAWDPSRSSAQQDLTEALYQVIRFYRGRADVLRAVLEVAAYDSVVRDFWNTRLDAFVHRAEGWLQSEQRAGRTPDEVDIVVSSRVFVLGGMQTLAQQVIDGPADADRAVAEELSALQWFGAFRRP